MNQPRPIDRPIRRQSHRSLPREGSGPTPSPFAGRTVEIETVVVPSIPLVEARERFLTSLRWKTSRVSNKRLTPATADKYRHWLNRFERWLIRSELPLDLGQLTPEDMLQLKGDILDEIDDGALQESSANTYARCVKTLFAATWEQLDLQPATNPALALHAGSQQAVDFPLFKTEHVKALLKAAVRPRTSNIRPWIPYRDQALLACFFDLGWRVGEASAALIEDVDFRLAAITIPRENVKNQRKGRSVGLNPETGRLLKAWIEKWRPATHHQFLFVTDDGDRCTPAASAACSGD